MTEAARLASMLGMDNPPPTLAGVIERAKTMLAEERAGRLAAEIENDIIKVLLDETGASLERAINMAVAFESQTSVLEERMFKEGITIEWRLS